MCACNTALSTEAADCVTGRVKLFNFTDSPAKATRQGTIQICINRAWGGVCGDNFFDTTDAEVFCDQLDGFQREGWTTLIASSSIQLHISFTDATVVLVDVSSSLVFLSSLRCTEKDQSLLEDCAHTQLGLAECSVTYLAGAECLGKIRSRFLHSILMLLLTRHK